MLRNFVLIAIRNFSRQKLYSFLNMLGLTSGITASILLFLYIQDELTYDRVHHKADRIYRVNTSAKVQDTELNAALTMAPMGPVLKNDYPEVQYFTRIITIGKELVKRGDQKFYEEGFVLADSSIFEIFDLTLRSGDPKTALVAPNSLVLTESLARKYFGSEDPMGKELKTGGDESVKTITGVMKDPFPNTHIKPSAIISYSSIPVEGRSQWGNINDHVYILLPEGYDYRLLEAKLPDVYDKYVSELFSQFGATASFSLTPFTDIHLHSDLEGEMEAPGSMAYLFIFGAIGFFVLLIASINYMNMATAQATTRAKEVGIRKVMGSHRAQLGWQFVIESVIITTISAVFSMIVAFFLLPSFNDLTDKQIPLDFYLYPNVWIGFLLIILFVGTVSGSYPAFYLSSFRPAQILKGRMASRSGNATLRKSLVVAQFSISLFMIVCTWIVFDQLNYVNTKDLGFNKEQVIRITLSGQDVRDRYSILRNKLLQHPSIESVGSGNSTPGGQNLNVQGISVESADGTMVSKVFQTIYANQDYLSTLQIPVVSGRDFMQNVGRDTSDAIIVNETMVKEMGWDEPLGKRFAIIINDKLETREAKVVGVIRDFHMRSLQEAIHPMVVRMSLNNGQMILRVRQEDMSGVLDYVATAWEELVPEKPLEYKFLSADFEESYAEEQRKGRLFALFSGLTVLIACMGLFGLASYNAELRKKEIGIRKAIGAGHTDILVLMSREFLRLVAISMVFAFPFAYYFMTDWLQAFSYRVDIRVLTFVLSAMITMVIALLTVGYHSLRSALSSPALYLKDE